MENDVLYALFRSCSGVSTDTRSIKGGELFIALKGDRFNGNEFVAHAIKQGCTAALTDDPAVAQEVAEAHYVTDVLKALQSLATMHRNSLPTVIIGLTGSNGKTTTKELLRDVLATKYSSYATRGNLNNHIGVPLSLLEITPDHEYAVIEMGANAQGEIALLSSISQPDYGMITNIGKAHIEGFGGLEGVKKGKGELFGFLRREKRRAFVNAADPVLLNLAQGMETILYGTDVHSPDVYMIDAEPFLTIGWSHHSYFSAPIVTHLVGEYNLANITAAIAIGRYFGVDPDAINSAIAAYRPDNNRSERRSTERNELILDAYNANPTSMQHALQSFARNSATRKLCILGDMLELGDETLNEHAAIIELVRSLKLNAIFVGPHFRDANDGGELFFEDLNAAEAYLKECKPSHLHILLKGSRGMRLEHLLPLL